METPIQYNDERPMRTLESQIRDCYARVLYSHKTHEKCADISLTRLRRIKMWQIILSAVTTGSIIIILFGATNFGAILGVVLSSSLLALNTYTKDYDLGEIAQRHKEAADKLWNIRESYLSLLTDIVVGHIKIESIQEKREDLQKKLVSIYTGAPQTNSKAYALAQESLKKYKEMTFSDEEINTFLPQPLRKNGSSKDTASVGK